MLSYDIFLYSYEVLYYLLSDTFSGSDFAEDYSVVCVVVVMVAPVVLQYHKRTLNLRLQMS
jgi:hypothetical protein